MAKAPPGDQPVGAFVFDCNRYLLDSAIRGGADPPPTRPSDERTDPQQGSPTGDHHPHLSPGDGKRRCDGRRAVDHRWGAGWCRGRRYRRGCGWAAGAVDGGAGRPRTLARMLHGVPGVPDRTQIPRPLLAGVQIPGPVLACCPDCGAGLTAFRVLPGGLRRDGEEQREPEGCGGNGKGGESWHISPVRDQAGLNGR